jgi:hypothetical protein
MTELVPELATFPMYGAFDGELVAFDQDGAPDFALLCERLLNHRRHIHPTDVIFDVLSLDGVSLMRAPYSERRLQPARVRCCERPGIRLLPTLPRGAAGRRRSFSPSPPGRPLQCTDSPFI